MIMFYQIFLSPQVKRIVIIRNKHDIHELPHELLNDLRLRILGKLGNIRKISIFKELHSNVQFFAYLKFCQY